MLVEGTGLVAVFPDANRIDCERAISRIGAVMRNTQVTLEIGEKPLRLDACARLAVVNTAA